MAAKATDAIRSGSGAFPTIHPASGAIGVQPQAARAMLRRAASWLAVSEDEMSIMCQFHKRRPGGGRR